MKGTDFIIFFLVIGILTLKAQEKISESEKSFSKIKVKKGTRDVTLINDYNKRWKMRVNFPETTEKRQHLIIALHWAGNGDTYKEFNDCLALPGLEALNAIIVSPEDEGQLWSTQNNVDKIRSIVANAQKYWNVDSEKIAVTGYSNGGNGSWFFAQNYPKLFSAALPMASAYAINTKIEIPLYVIHGAKDELFELARTEKWVMKTQEKGTDITWVVNNTLSHFQGCAYITELKKAAEWLKLRWKKK